VGADAVRKKLGSQNLVIKFTGSQGFTWGGQMQLDISDYKTLTVNGSFTVKNSGAGLNFNANGVLLADIQSKQTPNVNFSSNISAYNNLVITVGTCSFVGTMTLSV